MDRLTRRRALHALASTASLSLLAGCPVDGDGATPTQPSTPQGTPVDPEALRASTRTMVRRLATGEYGTIVEEQAMTDQLAAQVDAARLESIWAEQTVGLGRFVQVESVAYTQSQGYHVTEATVRFTGGVLVVRVTYDGRGRWAGLFFRTPGGEWSPPDYADESAFAELERTVQATDDCTLPAIVTIPTSGGGTDGGDNGGDEGPVPGVVLVHGSGPADMDETIGPNKVLKDLAWGLATRGVAVLRYDKRTYACDVDLTDVTLDAKVTDDALAALDVLAATDRVDPAATAVVGHSLGAMVAPRIATRADDLAGAAMLAANARPLPTLILEQVEYLATLDGTVSDAERRRIDAFTDAVERVRSGDVGDDEVVLNLGGDEWWADIAAYDQVATARSLDVPLTLHQGERDYQVSHEADFGRWRDALGGQAGVTFESYPTLNHLFMPGEGPPNPNEYFQPNNVDEAVVANLAQWVHDVTGV